MNETRVKNELAYQITNNIRNFCIRENLFTNGSVSQYNKMFDLACTLNIPSLAIACIIYVCSETDLTLNYITMEIKCIRGIA